MEKQKYTVCMDDNFHFMDEDERYVAGIYDSYEEAVAKCKQIVDNYLKSALKPNMTAAELYGSYTDYGDDPFIQPDPEYFSAWDYAKLRSEELTNA